MSFFNLPVQHREKPVSVHPWSKTIKDEYSNKIKYAHNSIKNVGYPKPKEKIPSEKRVKFTVIGNRVTKDFIYCVHLVQGMHKYRWKKFDNPVIRGVTSVEWPHVLNELKCQYGGESFCITLQVAVLCNDKFLGSVEELKKFIETKYCYHLALNYQRECVWQFIRFIKSAGRPCAYFHISLGEKPIGTMIFMLYSDVCPVTCENFLRLCKTTKGGYSGTPVHRIVRDGWIQCGGFGLKNTEMDCENFIVPYDRRGVLGMCNAGRHQDCSTQFFVLLQPAPWMKGRYVAFGQLIDGEQTLRRIEKVPTYYESPVLDLNIYSAGILNVDCRDLKINKSSNMYIESHIEDLVAVGDIFYQMLMEHVYLEIEFRRIAKLEALGEGEAENEDVPFVVEEDRKDIRATQRFIRKKGDFKRPVDNTQQHSTDVSVHEKKEKEDNENNDFDVEDYSYEAEEYSYNQVTPKSSTVVKPKIPFYLPFIDVPYPGEVDSNFDLKRFLQGDYCLESDLDPEAVKIGKKCDQQKLNDLSEALESYKNQNENDIVDQEDDDYDLDSDDEMEIKKYLKIYGERVSFPGVIVNKMAKKYAHRNPLEYDTISFTDEEVRRLKLGIADLKARENKRVSIAAEPWEAPHIQIKRRQTGFMRPADLRELLKRQMAQEDDDDDDDEYQKRYDEREDDQEKVQEEEEEENHERRAQARRVRKVKGHQEPHRRHYHMDNEERDEHDNGFDITRPSALVRLFDEVANASDTNGPTLKDYKPSDGKKRNMLLTYSGGVMKSHHLLQTENYFRSSITPDDDFDEILACQYDKKIGMRTSLSYAKPIDPTERRVEFGRPRPSLSVSEYQMKNQMRAQMEANKQKNTTELKRHADAGKTSK